MINLPASNDENNLQINVNWISITNNDTQGIRITFFGKFTVVPATE